MAASSRTWLLFGALVLFTSASSAIATTTWPSCPSDNPCPKTGTYYHCLTGRAINGCQLNNPFQKADCSKQCVSKPPTATSTCPTAVPCPADGTTYYHCSKGQATNGCRKVSDGPFPSTDCSAQCTYNSANPLYIPPACPCDTCNPCPTDGQYYFLCKVTGECRPQALGWIPNCSSKGEQCLMPPATSVCPASNPCPKDGTAYYYCQAGKVHNGCQSVAQGPFPPADCTLQCKTA